MTKQRGLYQSNVTSSLGAIQSPGHHHRAENCKMIYCHCFLHRDQNERSPLHLAASKGSTRCCEAILQKFQDCINMLDRNKVSNVVARWPKRRTNIFLTGTGEGKGVGRRA